MNSLKSNTVKNQVTFDDMKLATDGLRNNKKNPEETVIIPLSTISRQKSVTIPLLTISGMITRIITRSSMK